MEPGGKEKLRGCEFFSRPMVPRRCPFQLKKSPVVAPSTRLATWTDLVLDLQVQQNLIEAFHESIDVTPARLSRNFVEPALLAPEVVEAEHSVTAR